MRIKSFVHRYVPPFMSGVFAGGICVADGSLTLAVLAIAAVGFAYASLPAGQRAIRQLVQVDS